LTAIKRSLAPEFSGNTGDVDGHQRLAGRASVQCFPAWPGKGPLGAVISQPVASSKDWPCRVASADAKSSWAVPKRLSMNPAEKHLAIRTEDHPLE
jgi:DNA polymerase ligase (LigD)-like protein